MRSLPTAVLIVLSSAAVLLRADVTIRYKTEMLTPMTPAANRSGSTVIHMKGNKGVTIADNQTTIVDFARQQVTIIDTVARKYATFPASEYGAKMGAQVAGMMPQAPGMDEMMKSMKVACDTKKSGVPETIQGVQAEEREVTCNLTVTMPESMKQVMPSISMKFVMRIWSASQGERLRVPGLWQLSSYELWQNYFMNPVGALGKMAPDAMMPMVEAMQKDQSVTLRSNIEMSMKNPMLGAGAGTAAGEMPIMKMNQDAVSLSTELLDDSLFSVPSDYAAVPFDELMKGITAAAMESAKAGTANAAAAPKAAIPGNVKAYVPSLVPVSQSKPVAPVDASGNKVQGMVQILVTVGPKGNVERTEVLSGPEALRKAAVDAVTQWTYRPVMRDGAPVAAYTEASVDFNDYSKGSRAASAFKFTPDMAAAAERIAQLEQAMPRSPEQEFADLEQDTGGDKSRRYDRLGELALKAYRLGNNEKAKAYADELLSSAQQDTGGWNYGNAIHKGHMALGLVALRGGDVVTARRELLESGKTPGSPQLSSFGPNMTLAGELLKNGDRDAVLEYFELCRKFWKMGGQQLDSWSETVHNGGTPEFGANLLY